MPKSIYKTENAFFRELLIKERKAAGITQVALSEKLGKPQSFVSKYESGERRLDVIEFIEIARALGIDPSKIVKKIYTKKTSS